MTSINTFKVKTNFGRLVPSFMCIGVQKGGTSSLYHYLLQHPSILGPKEKELHFFDTLSCPPISEYLKLFPKSYFTQKVTFEATPKYIYYPGVAEKIYKFKPDMKFIVMLRDPVSRAYSAWNMYREMAQNERYIEFFRKKEAKSPKEQFYSYFCKKSFPSFDDWVQLELSPSFDNSLIEPSIVRRGYYKDQIETYFNYFAKESFLFIDFDQFKADPNPDLDSILTFLNLPAFDFSDFVNEVQNKREYVSAINDTTRSYLKQHYQAKNSGLDQLVQINFDWNK